MVDMKYYIKGMLKEFPEKVKATTKGTINDVPTFEADDTQELKWYIGIAFAVHDNMKSHTGATLTLGKG
eukprot:13100543-Ditylum_brightwellii.AAC.1